MTRSLLKKVVVGCKQKVYAAAGRTTTPATANATV
jgi:hypothetical protein